ncbi:MAG TPA: oxidoreductase [Bacteroidales bacterium]|jgi:predicted aldo/keto reductase-like oxidoreductase|nr:oxidoreductase [Bacteroidales bacterium]
MKPFDRRNFLKTGAVSIAGLAIGKELKASPKNHHSSEPSRVITRKLGNTGIQIPIVSLGVGRCDSPAVVKGALKLGMNHFDTAHVYQQGNSEKMLGEVLKEYPRESFTIATKVKTMNSKEKFMETLDTSLERLQMDYVDILYLHAKNNRKSTLDAEMLEALKMAKKLGKAKHLGVSTHSNEPEVIQAAIDSGVYEVVLTSVNFKQEHSAQLKEKIAEAASKGIGIVGMKVMAGGYMDKEKLVPVNYTAALKWVLQDENIHTTIPSMVNLEQLMNNASVLQELEFNEQEKNDLAFASELEGLFCNACSNCVKNCTKKLPIPGLMRAYMYSYGYGETQKAKALVESLALNDNPCQNCNTCKARCVKGFNIAEKINDINRLKRIPSEFLT